MALEPRSRRPFRILCLVGGLALQDPVLVPLLSNACNEVRVGDAQLRPQVQEVLGGEATRSFGWLVCEEETAERVEATRFCSECQRVVRSHRLRSEEAPHAILDGEHPGVDLRRNEGSVELLELPTVGTLWVLEQDHPLRTVGPSHEDSTFGSVA